MFKTEKWKESNHLALNFFRPLANPHILPVMYLYIIFPMLPPWEMNQKILCATEVTENRNCSCSDFVVQTCCSVTKSCLTLCSLMDCSTPGLPVPHHLLEFAQVHIHWVGDAIQPSHPLWPPSPPAPQSFPVSVFSNELLFTSGSQSIGASASASVLPVSIQGWFPLRLTGLSSLQSRGLSRVYSSTTFRWHQSWVLSLLYGPTLVSVHDYWKDHAAAAAKSLQSCPTLCDPIDGNGPLLHCLGLS